MTLPYQSYLKECKSIYKKYTCIPMIIAALFTTAKLWNQLRCPTTDKWIKKIYIHTHIMEYYSAIK
jgi:hypothetical protein